MSKITYFTPFAKGWRRALRVGGILTGLKNLPVASRQRPSFSKRVKCSCCEMHSQPCHPHESGDAFGWIPAFAGMTRGTRMAKGFLAKHVISHQLIWLCTIILSLFLSEMAIAQTFTFQSTPSQTNSPTTSNRTPLTADQFQKNVSNMADKNRKALAAAAKANQKPLPSNVLPPSKKLGTTNKPATGSPPVVTNESQPTNYEKPAIQTTITPKPAQAAPKTSSTPQNQPNQSQGQYYTGFPSNGGGSGSNTTPKNSGSGGQWNINY